MDINIRTRGFRFSETLHDYVTSKLYLALSRYGDHIQKVDFTLLEVNGPKGREYSKCIVSLKLHNHPDPIVACDSLVDIHDAISACAQRAKRAVERHFSRVQHIIRKSHCKYA